MDIKFDELLGPHMLTGVDYDPAVKSLLQTDVSIDNAQVVNFVLDGKTYTALEDPGDGYRSSLDSIQVTDFVVSNQFDPIQVVCVARPGDQWGVLDFIDIVNGQTVLSIGTDYTYDYYHTFVCEWNPDKLHVNNP